MPLCEVTDSQLRPIAETRFGDVGLRERADLQRLLRIHVDVISPDTMVIAEEFGDWEDSRRRIDLLGIDKDANLIVIELKRTDDGGHMDLQAIRYAAMVSTLTFAQAVEAHRSYLQAMGSDEDPQSAILEFLGWDEPEEELFAQDVRIVLASAEFSRELTTAVVWLNDRTLDIRCVRLRPYQYGDRVLLDAQQVLPLPEVEDYQVRLREKGQRERLERQTNSERHQRRYAFWSTLLERARSRTNIHANVSPGVYHYIAAGSGIRGLGLNYTLRQHDSTVELYIDRGTGADAENLRVFDELHSGKASIEEQLSARLDWKRLEGKRACRIAWRFSLGGWRDEREKWPEVQNQMIDAMIRFEKALRPHLERIKHDVLATEEVAQAN